MPQFDPFIFLPIIFFTSINFLIFYFLVRKFFIRFILLRRFMLQEFIKACENAETTYVICTKAVVMEKLTWFLYDPARPLYRKF